MTEQHPITPPPKLVQQWCDPRVTGSMHFSETDLATRAAQWGADQELQALLVWLRVKGFDNLASDLLSARRPEPPSLKEQALDALTLLCKGPDATAFVTCRDTIRRALEQLDD